MDYDGFLHSKIQVAPVSGFDIGPEDINPALKPHQRDAVIWAIKGGRRALFEAFSLGKTVQELEWCRLVECPCCETKALVMAGSPAAAAYKTFGHKAGGVGREILE